MQVLGQRLGGLYAESMQVQIFGIFAALKQPLGFRRRRTPDGNQRQSEHIPLAGVLGGEKIGDARLRPSFCRGKVNRSSSRT